ncbi:hypothetical protein SESBI_01840 [Sesbania bispinosa]|nr:hypothetical protein SESBI_01840 [Sesbania bispinosa]
MAAFALHKYICNNSQDDIMFILLEQHPNYIPHDELPDMGHNDTSREHVEERSTEMKEIHNNIANLSWETRS